MRIVGSQVSCGVNELVIDPGDKVTKRSLTKALLHDGLGVSAMIVTTVNTKSRPKDVAVFKKNKFKEVSCAKSSTGVFVLLVRRFTADEIRQAKASHKKRYRYAY